MICPNDGSTALVADTLDGESVHDCTACGGVWVETNLPLTADLSSEESRKKCPVCGEPLRTLLYPQSEIRIDICVDDHGVWLDKGEYDGIIDQLDHVENTMSAHDYEQATVEQLKEILHPHASRWEEIKDFFSVFKLMEMRIGTEHPTLGKVAEAAYRSGL